MKNPVLLSLLTILLASCGTLKQPYYSDDGMEWQSQKPSDGKEVIHSLYLVGDTGELDDLEAKTNIVLEVLKVNIVKEDVETSLVFLGDNIYPDGMPPEDSKERPMAEDIINAQLECAKYHEGNTYFIPGNHDWNHYSPGGRDAVLRQENYVESYFDEKDIKVRHYPTDACGDPKEVKIHKDLVFVFIDSQWWLQDWSQEKKMNKGCELKSRGDFLKRMEEIMTDHKNDEIVVMMHHPIKSDGTHGGKFGIKQHLFPLTEFKDNLWIPLPILGSIYPIYRTMTGSIQDIPNENNRALMQGLDNIAKKLMVDVIFISGHDHGLQHFEEEEIQYIISGAGGKTDFVKREGKAEYARSARGYVRLNFHEDFEVWADYFVVDPATKEASVEFRKQLRAPRAGTVEKEIIYPPITEKTKIIAANEKFAAGPFKKFFLGSQYRDIWATPVEAENIDLESKYGGLTPIKKGGGMASNSLRMEKEDGHQYILRSIKKDYTKLVPEGFKNLKLLDILADQNSASHPYNALIIPRLSEAANVYYTNPKLVFLQHQRGLKNYNSFFAEELYLLEERPDGDWSNAIQFGNAPEIIGYTDLLETLRDKKNQFIDQEWVLKSRMFDILIHDWDRHDDQWRWAKFDEDGKNVYRPIPRDRDQAFYKFEGVVPWYIAAFVVKKFKTIKGDLKDVKNHSFNARHFDRYFLHELEWSQWEEVILELQTQIKDQDIDQAIDLFPPEIMHIKDVPELADLLKSRRNNLMKIGKKLYNFLSKEVDIPGTDNEDDFFIHKNQDGSVKVKHTLVSDDHGTLTKYERTFYPNETKEIRLYGLRDKDHFTIVGFDNKDIKIRIIGGEDDDTVINDTQSGKIIVYDDLAGIEVFGKVSDKTNQDLNINKYERDGFNYNTNFPILYFGNTVDDGWWLGGSINWVKNGWRKTPYKSKQKFSVSAAPGSQNAFQFGYNGHFPALIGSLDFAPATSLNYPEYENFFGLGNNSIHELSQPREFNWVRMENIDINPRLRYNIGSRGSLDFGPLFSLKKIVNTEDRISEDMILGFSEDELQSRSYWGGDVLLAIGKVDNNVYPSNGLRVSASASYFIEPNQDESVSEFNVSAQFYLRLANRPKLVFATQIGYGKSIGDLQFYQYQALGNNRGLRGFRNERFRGQGAFFQNLDLRVKLIEWENIYIPMDIGILFGYDYGRVRLDNENFETWHRSQTIGIWFELLGAIVLQPYFSLTPEENTFTLRLGFNF